ncbi:hypothetical protein CROQUDRAFT_129422 [Cronartium quercuum f. sp. fusiforme G11]|uniref:Uncharacterized protein n=1 Tax=Cronartium quercuum f. sp. fusiforme G11 TaxID=708437 RepID=A0A9P6THE5_9BASI|nr:hypothetical protein CROQUDRAFT_129422 [Cronartium quercuum f. sp. fusiforme G11]
MQFVNSKFAYEYEGVDIVHGLKGILTAIYMGRSVWAQEFKALALKQVSDAATNQFPTHEDHEAGMPLIPSECQANDQWIAIGTSTCGCDCRVQRDMVKGK